MKDIIKLDDKKAHFADGRIENADVIFYCTGKASKKYLLHTEKKKKNWLILKRFKLKVSN